jgi:hypothetical protein
MFLLPESGLKFSYLSKIVLAVQRGVWMRVRGRFELEIGTNCGVAGPHITTHWNFEDTAQTTTMRPSRKNARRWDYGWNPLDSSSLLSVTGFDI